MEWKNWRSSIVRLNWSTVEIWHAQREDELENFTKNQPKLNNFISLNWRRERIETLYLSIKLSVTVSCIKSLLRWNSTLLQQLFYFGFSAPEYQRQLAFNFKYWCKTGHRGLALSSFIYRSELVYITRSRVVWSLVHPVQIDIEKTRISK